MNLNCEPIRRELSNTLSSIWKDMLGLPTSPTAAIEPSSDSLDMLSASIAISGAWAGKITVCLERCLVLKIASIMFKRSETKLSEEEIDDALREMTNMLGGNIKFVLPQSSQGKQCSLSIPSSANNKTPTTDSLVFQSHFADDIGNISIYIHCMLE